MARVRIRIAHGARAEIYEIEKRDVVVGRDEACDLAIDHSTVSRKHVHLAVRRGRLILSRAPDAGPVDARGDRVSGAFVLRPGEPFRLGDVWASARLESDGETSLVGRRLAHGVVSAEIDSPDAACRRYRVERPNRLTAELSVPLAASSPVEGSGSTSWPPAGDIIDADADLPHETWLARAARICLAPGRFGLLEEVGSGVRLAVLLEAIARGRVQLSRAVVVLLARLVDAVRDYHRSAGPHGHLEPRRIHVGEDGRMVLLRPGPVDEWRNLDNVFLTPRRRMGAPKSEAEDLGSLFVVGRFIAQFGPELLRKIWSETAMVHPEAPEATARKLRELSARSRDLAHAFDATEADVARVVRLLQPDLSQPLARRT